MAELRVDSQIITDEQHRNDPDPHPQYLRRQADALTVHGDVIERLYGPGFVIKGCNLGYITNTGAGRMDTTFVLEYDRDWVHECIDTIAGLGCNTIRIQGGYWIWLLDPANYKRRVHDAWTYAHSKGLIVLATLCDSPDMPIDAAKTDAIKPFMDDMLDGFTDTPMMIWDVGNELEETAPAIELAQYLRTIKGDGQLLTSSGTGISSWISALDPYVDFHSFNYYFPITPLYPYFGARHMDWYRAFTGKPIVITEIGTNATAGGNEPRFADQVQRAQYLKDAARWVASGAVQGLIAWKLTSNESNHDFGLIDRFGNPTLGLSEVSRWPSNKSALSPENPIPIVYDNFARPDSSTAVGSPPLGAAPNAVGLFGIVSNQGKLITPAAQPLPISYLLWQANTADGQIEAEFNLPTSGTCTVGLIWRWTDENNFYRWRWADGQLALIRREGGVDTNITPPDRLNGGTTTGVPLPGYPAQPGHHVRLGLYHVFNLLIATYYDRPFMVWEERPALAGGTRGGVFMADNDSGSTIRRVTLSAPALGL